MIDIFPIIALGFFLGMRHATDPDHIIAITTIVARHRTIKNAVLIGASWGLGHTLTILTVGGAIILLGLVIPVRVGLSMEFSLALMLILLGLMNLSGNLKRVTQFSSSTHRVQGQLHSHSHTDDNSIDTHPREFSLEAHAKSQHATLSWLDGCFAGIGFYQILRPLFVGLIHGLAGSAAVALLVLTTIQSAKWAIAYLVVFGIGTIGGTMLITGVVVLPFAYTSTQSVRVNQGLRLASGLISVAFGLFLAYRIGFVDG